MVFTPEFIKDGKDSSFASGSEFKGALGRVEDPTKYLFSLRPTSIPLESFLF